MNGSVCLGQIHSDPWRNQIEAIYLSALDVSTQRFQFDVQFFGDSATVFAATWQSQMARRRRPRSLKVNRRRSATRSTTRRPGIPNSFSMQKEFATGGDQLMVGVANSFMWQFAGHDSNNANSLINFNFIQPLLRGGGRQFVLEELTRPERNLLYDMRHYQRYRQGFYTTVTVGNSVAGPVQNVTRIGGLLGGTGLTGFTGQGVAVKAVSACCSAALPPAAAAAIKVWAVPVSPAAAPARSADSSACCSTCRTCRIAQFQVDVSFVHTLGLLEANLDAGLSTSCKSTTSARTSKPNAPRMLNNQVIYQNSLDAFKSTVLTLPPNLSVIWNDSMLKQFEFLDRRTITVQHRVEDLLRAVGKLPDEPNRGDLAAAIEALSGLHDRLTEPFIIAHDDLKTLDGAVPERKKTMTADRTAQFDRDVVKMAEGLTDVETRYRETDHGLQGLRDRLHTAPTNKLADDVVAYATHLSGLARADARRRGHASRPSRCHTLAWTPIVHWTSPALTGSTG